MQNLALRFAQPFLFAFLLGLTAQSSQAVSVGQADTFQDGTTDGWANGGIQPVNVANGGPAGDGDRFLQVTADGSGMTGRLTVFNRTQWLGNYVAAGVNETDLDLNNFSSLTVSIRLAFKSGTFNGAAGYETTSAFTLPAKSGWMHAVFLLTPDSMTVGTPSAFSTFFTNPAEFRIINASTTGDLNGSNVTAQLGLDNLIAVPEARSLGLLICGLVGLAMRICFGRPR